MAILSEAALAEVVEGMGLVSRAEKHINFMESRLAHCRVEVDGDSFKHLRYYLDQIHAQLAPKVLDHAEAVAASKPGAK